MNFIDIINKAEKGHKVNKEEIIHLLKAQGQDKTHLIEFANKIRKEDMGEEVILRGIVEFSNYCRKSCNYCGIRKQNKINRYRISIDEIMEAVNQINKHKIPTVVLQSGEDPWWDSEKIVKLIKMIKKETKLEVTLSIGERSKEEYKKFKEAGADKFLLKIEATNDLIFKEAHPDDTLKGRRQCSRWLKELGYINGSGCIIGLPKQTIEDIAGDIIFFKDMEMDMIGIGPFVPAKNTPYEKYPQGDVELTIKAIAITRIICRGAHLPATTALETLHPNGQVKALEAGANVIMLNFTPQIYGKQYKIYSNKANIGLEKAIESIKKAGRTVNI